MDIQVSGGQVSLFWESINNPQIEGTPFESTIIEGRIISKKRRNNQNAARTVLRKLKKVIRKIFKKTYKIHQFGLEDKRQIFAIFRAAIFQQCLPLIQQKLYQSQKALIEELNSGNLSNIDKNYKTACLCKYLCSLKEEHLNEQNLEQSLEALFGVGQKKNHKINENYKLVNYLKYEQKVWAELIE